ncbi:MAG TPA: class I SAM-dependent methyltransferase [Burkholderiales bacterium]|nr:class I SAM-dependent methyltransferase [Burkholderiales bacterium]
MVTRRGFLKSSALLPGVLFSQSGQALVAGEPSRTARGAALQRAAHQLLEVPRVFDDPLALRIFGAQGVAWLGRNLENYRTPGSRSMRAFLVMRSRFAEDELARAYARGVRQYVVLGAGLDTFAYRNPHRGLRVFEVDHPSTQAWKRSRLAEQSIGVPRSMRFTPVDFETQTLAGGLKAAGFRADRPAFFSWLGVTIYLSKPAVEGTLRYIASLPRGSQVVFDFSPPLSELGDAERRGHEKSAANVARSGEPWIGYFSPAALVDEMRSGGFSSAQALGSGEMNRRYFRGRTDGFQLHGSGRIMAAQV